MTKSKRKQSEKEPSSIQDDDYDSKYVEYGSPSNAERLASSLAEDSSGDSGTSYGYDHGSQGRLQRNQASMGSQSSDDNVSSDDNFFAQVPIRSRQRFTVQEISTLEKIYEKSERPSTDIKQNLANKLNTTVNRIQIWFQNRRAKDKKTTREQNKSPEGSDIARAHGINEPESRAAARGSSELGARRDSAESLSQVLSRCDSITHEFKRRADNGPEVSHNKKKKPVYQSAQGNPSASIEGHNVHPFANVPTLYRYPTTVELFPPYCWPGYLSRIASGSNLMPSDQQEPVLPYVNPQKMLKKQYEPPQTQYTTVESTVHTIPDASLQLQVVGESSASTSGSMVDDLEKMTKLPSKGELYKKTNHKNARREKGLD